MSHARTLDRVQALSGIAAATLHIVGGASENSLLCQRPGRPHHQPHALCPSLRRQPADRSLVALTPFDATYFAGQRADHASALGRSQWLSTRTTRLPSGSTSRRIREDVASSGPSCAIPPSDKRLAAAVRSPS